MKSSRVRFDRESNRNNDTLNNKWERNRYYRLSYSSNNNNNIHHHPQVIWSSGSVHPLSGRSRPPHVPYAKTMIGLPHLVTRSYLAPPPPPSLPILLLPQTNEKLSTFYIAPHFPSLIHGKVCSIKSEVGAKGGRRNRQPPDQIPR